jgi:hypothetical protein
MKLFPLRLDAIQTIGGYKKKKTKKKKVVILLLCRGGECVKAERKSGAGIARTGLW